MASSSEKHWFNAKGFDRNGGGHDFAVSKKGRSIYIQEVGGKRHLCHPSVGGIESVRGEIALVFRVEVSKIDK